MTQSAFLAFYPQFQIYAQGVVLTEYIQQANARFSDFDEDAEEARRLFVAHKLTLYAESSLPEGVTPTRERIAAAGRGLRQEVASKKVGEVSVSYTETSALKSVNTGLQDLTETTYGMQLISLLRIYGFGKYIE
jgi:hypothetical protein